MKINQSVVNKAYLNTLGNRKVDKSDKNTVNEPKVDRIEVSANAKLALNTVNATRRVASEINERFNSQRLGELREQIKNNEYKVDDEKIADAILSHYNSYKGII